MGGIFAVVWRPLIALTLLPPLLPTRAPCSYLFTQFAGGVLSSRFGAKAVLGYGILGSAVANLLTPLAVAQSWETAVVLRALSGVFEGVTFPAMNVLWSKWAPPLERSRLCGNALAGCYLGSFAALPIWGALCSNGHWEWTFYVGGGSGVAWTALWMLLAAK